jgi:hypothetical protein
MCLVYDLTEIKCPLCGFTRSMIELTHFNLSQSLHFNILSPLIIYILVTEFFNLKYKISLKTTVTTLILFTIIRNLPIYPLF